MNGEESKYKLVKYLKKVEDKIEILLQRNSYIEKNKFLIAFRGEAKDYGKTKLMPSLFRDSTYVAKEKYLFDLLCDYGVIPKEKSGNIEKAIETQHYVAISRMLDITFNILPAMYFACISEENKNFDGKIYIFCFPEHYSPNSEYIEEFYSNILKGKNLAYSKNFKVVSHSYSNERIKAQSGGFIFFQGREFSPISEIYYEVVNIEKEDKNHILEDLELLFGINDATLFPEKDRVAKLVGEKFKYECYNDKQLSIESEIYTYFERMQYESRMYKKKIGQDYDKISFLRKLRKEKGDLISYINEHVIDENIKKDDGEKWVKYIIDSFKILELK